MKEYNWSTIEKYFEGDLTPKERDAFEKLMRDGKSFKEAVNLYEEIENSLTSRASNQKGENDLRNTLEDLGKIHIKEDQQSTEAPKVFSLQRYGKYLVAASLVVFATLFYFKNAKASYADFAKHPTLDLVVRGSASAHLLEAQDAFNAKNYVLAEKELRAVLAEDATKVELQLYLAISLIEQGKFELADSILEKIRIGKSIYKNKATWNLALSKLKQKEYKACRIILMTIPTDAEDFANARKLLGKL